ncbi:hypothetical protein PINS_up012211 [Pythium insidiosum]|nr:hypothetical protein PINS_up012211 [Pythium insidiosum]
MAESPSKRARATTALDAIHDVAVKAARAAGAHMKAQLLTAAVEKTKSSKDDLVTVVDKQCQDLVFSTIKEVFPSHEFLGEESVEPGSDASARALREMEGKEWLWIVDPIDGTTNFVHHRPSSVVSVACAHHGQVVVGVIYDPYRDELFAAQRGKGTTLNGKSVRVSPEATFGEALVGFGIGTKDSVRLPMLDCVRELSAKCRGIRLQGAAAIELAWTACGRQTVRVCLEPGLLHGAHTVLLTTAIDAATLRRSMSWTSTRGTSRPARCSWRRPAARSRTAQGSRSRSARATSSCPTARATSTRHCSRSSRRPTPCTCAPEWRIISVLRPHTLSK